MKKLIKTNFLQFFQIVMMGVFILLPSVISAQVTIGADSEPKATLDVVANSAVNIPVGVIAPRISLSELNAKVAAGAYTEAQKGAIVYIASIDDVGVDVDATAKVEGVGYYYFDGVQWLRFVIPDVVVIPSEPWYVAGTGVEATQNSDNIYQNAQVAVGKDLASEAIEPSAQLEVNSNSKGFLVPRLNRQQIERISNPAESLLIWNIDEGCFNFRKGDRWRSMCGGLGDAEIQILAADCENGKVKGAYKVGNSVTGGEFIDITLDVIEPGTYSIEATPSDKVTGETGGFGFFFQRSGSFSAAGKYSIQIPALGTPQKDGIFNLEMKLNGIAFDPTCVKEVEIEPANAKFYFVGPCGQKAADKLERGERSTDKTIDVKVVIVNTGVFNFSTSTVYGVNYSATGLNLTAGEHTIVMTANGVAPSQAGENIVFKVTGTGWDATATAGTGNSECEVLVDIEEGFAELNIDASTAKVLGAYPLNKETSSNAGNYIEVKATVSKPGFWTGVATGPDGVGFEFSNEGTLGTGDVGSTPITLKLYPEGEALKLGPQVFTLVINGGTPVTLTVNVAYREVSIASFGFVNYQPYGASANRSSRVILESAANFGVSGKVPTLGVKVVGGGNTGGVGVIATYLASNNPDIVIIGYNHHTNAADNQALKDFMDNKKGVVLVMSQDNAAADVALINHITGGSMTMAAGNQPNFVSPLTGIDHPILNGPFGDVRNQNWGDDVGTTFRITSALPTSVQGLSNSNDMIVYKQFMWVGDGGFISGTKNNVDNPAAGIWPCITDDGGRPVAKQYVGAKVYNAHIYANFIAWAIDYVQKNKTN